MSFVADSSHLSRTSLLRFDAQLVLAGSSVLSLVFTSNASWMGSRSQPKTTHAADLTVNFTILRQLTVN